MPTPSTLNEALAEIEVLNTQIAYLTEQADIASAITNKVIPDYSTVLGNINTNMGSMVENTEDIAYATATIADNTTPVTAGTPTAAPAAPVVNTGVV